MFFKTMTGNRVDKLQKDAMVIHYSDSLRSDSNPKTINSGIFAGQQRNAMKKEKTTFFDGLVFNYFGINRNSKACASHFPSFYGIQYVSSGSLKLRVDHGPVHTLSGPVAFLTCPEHYIEYSPLEKNGRDHYFVCFSGERVKHYLESGLFPVDPECPYAAIANPEQFLNEILDLIRMLQDKKNYAFSVAKLEYLLLSMIQPEETEKDAGFYRNALETLVRKIMIAPENAWDFSREAAKLHISEKHFIRLFHRLNGIAPYRFVLRQRLFKAAEILIREEKTSIKAAAYESGFHDEYYFSRVFKKYFHVAPNLYRNRKKYTNGPYSGIKKQSEQKDI